MRAIVRINPNSASLHTHVLVINPDEPGERMLGLRDGEFAELAASIEEIMGAQT